MATELPNAHRPVQETADALREQAIKESIDKAKVQQSKPLAQQILDAIPQQPSAPKKPTSSNRTQQFIDACTPEQLERLKTMTEDDFMADASMQAIPFEMPEMLTVKLRDALYLPRWVNWKGHGGANYGKMRAIGFIPCTEEDVVPGCLDPNVFKPGTMGRYEYYDVILMKIHKLRYFAALKANLIASRAVTNDRNNIMQAARTEADNVLRNDVGDRGLSSLAGKVSTFVPTAAEAAALK